MTMFGKVLALLNFALSVAIFAVALASWSNPVDFTNSPGKDGNPPGKYKVNADKLTAAWSKIPPSVVAMDESRKSLARFEQYRDAHQFFAVKLESLRSAPVGTQVEAVKYNLAVPAVNVAKPAELLMEPALDLAGKQLYSMKVYEGAIADLRKKVAEEELRYKEGVAEETKLNDKRSGAKGLQQRIVDQQGLLKQVGEEKDRIEPLWVNAYVESELIVRRREALDARLAELKRAEKSAGPAVLGRKED
jgi:hypothetical protein